MLMVTEAGAAQQVAGEVAPAHARSAQWADDLFRAA